MKPRKYVELGHPHHTVDGVPPTNTNLYRRNLLKMFLVGGGGFLLGKFADPLIDFVQGDKVISTKDFENFKFVETEREIRVLDNGGDEIIIFDKDSLSL